MGSVVGVFSGMRGRLFTCRLLSALLVVLATTFAPSAALAQCALNSADPSVTVCTPANGATVSSPVHLVAGTTSSAPVVAMQIYEDDNLVYSNSSNTL